VEFRIQEVLEAKLRTILEESAWIRRVTCWTRSRATGCSNRMFVEALLHPDRVAEEADSIADTLRLEAVEHRQRPRPAGG
jgi:hypothetical protein